MAWALLFIAGALETVWALALKESDGFTRLGATLLVVVVGIASFTLLALALREIPVGTGYAVWTGIGVVGVAIAGIVWFDESAAATRLIPIALITVGTVWLSSPLGR